MIGNYIRLLYNVREKYLKEHLSDCSILVNNTEHSILIYLKYNDTVIQNDLQKYIKVNKSNITRNLKALETKGLIKRVLSNIDSRSIDVSLTDKGLTFVDNELHLIIDDFNSLFTKDEERYLEELIHKISNRIKGKEE